MYLCVGRFAEGTSDFSMLRLIPAVDGSLKGGCPMQQ